ncbi:hypothetical protein [Geminocystis sp.]|uniref:hypothetical protein n=1 Tax=Geminocystis sp. TaxID=2664100 RepID=UPI003593A772
MKKKNWGDWFLNEKNLTLTNKTNDYEIDLETIKSSADILDWIYQVFKKQWNDQQIMYDLLCAFQDLFKPQVNYCSFGKEKKADGGQLVKHYLKS